MFKRSRLTKVALIVALLAVVGVFIPLPYYVSTPGSAQDIKTFVQVENGHKTEGDFMLLTVSMGPANIYRYASTFFNKYNHLYKKEEILGTGGSKEEYNYQQLHMMKNSQDAAIEVAYSKANKKVERVFNGIIVLHVVDDMPAKGKVELGDIITKIDGQELATSEAFIKYLSSKKEGDIVKITFVRNKKEQTVDIPLKTLKDDSKRAGIGIVMGEDSTLNVEPNVKIDTEKIGGPSAGLMFSLQMYNQLMSGDTTKGYRIAGTGTIDREGKVGPIGGADQKLVAADKAGADIVFAPSVKTDGKSNYDEMVAAAKDIGSKIKVVPVETFDDAVKYLEALPQKNK